VQYGPATEKKPAQHKKYGESDNQINDGDCAAHD
jgi:hypothetical protein